MDLLKTFRQLAMVFLKIVICWPANVLACFRPFVGGWYVPFAHLIITPFALLGVHALGVWLFVPGGSVMDDSRQSLGLGLLGVVAATGFFWNRWRHFMRLEGKKVIPYGTHSGWPGDWWGMAPTLGAWIAFLPWPVMSLGFLIGSHGFPTVGALLVWLGFAILCEGLSFISSAVEGLRLRMDAVAVQGAIITDPEHVNEWAQAWRWITAAPLRDANGRPNTGDGPGKIVFFPQSF